MSNQTMGPKPPMGFDELLRDALLGEHPDYHMPFELVRREDRELDLSPYEVPEVTPVDELLIELRRIADQCDADARSSASNLFSSVRMHAVSRRILTAVARFEAAREP